MRVMMMTLLALAIMFPGLAAAQAVTVLPAGPKIGDRVEVRYNEAAAGSAIRGAATMRMEAMVMCLDDAPVLHESDMKRDGPLWKGTFELSGPSARLIVLRIVSGDQVEDNGGRPPSILVCGESGKPLEDAHRLNGALMAGEGVMEFKHAVNYPSARAEVQKERDLYPGNHRTWVTEWGILWREKPGAETREYIRKALGVYEVRFAGNEAAMAAGLNWMEQVGLESRADSLRKAAIRESPRGKIAEEAGRMEAVRERNPARRGELLEKFLADFPQKGSAAATMNQMLISSLIQSGKTDEAIARLKASPAGNPMLYNQVAWTLIEKGEKLDTAVALASSGVALARNPSPDSKPGYVRMSDWERQNTMSLGMVLDTYALGLSKQGRYREAADAYKEAFGILMGEAAEVSERYVDCLLKLGKPDEALAVSREAFVKGKSSEKLVLYYREAFVKAKGSDSGFDAEMAAATAKRDDATRAKILKNRMNKPAADFTLKDMAGKSVSLASLKGKVVVIDFWATWCGPCKASFPTLQKVYDRYRANDRVAIYAVNTAERQSGTERQALVEKFMADNKYTFPVLYDEGAIDRYGVEGIPTKFVVDKKGKIAFKTVGFNGADEMMTEMTIQLDLLLAEE